jgi:hypothetical protein
MGGLTIQRSSRKEWRRLGPYSKKLDRGPVGMAVDGRSFEGRFIRAMETELLAALNGEATIFERLLVDQAIRLKMQFDGLTEKLDAAGTSAASWTDHDIRTLNAIGNQYRLTLRELRNRPKVRSQRAHARSLDALLDGMAIDAEARTAALPPAAPLPQLSSEMPVQPSPMRLQRPAR